MSETTLHEQTVEYADSRGTRLVGHAAWDATSDARRPGVMVIHEWWGVNDYARRRARMLAELGYVGLAIDMYGEGRTADNPDDAAALMNAVLSDVALAEDRLHAGVEALKALPVTDPERLAAIGYCFGGAMVLHAARIGMPLRAVVSFHGLLKPLKPAEPGRVKARVLVCHGADDGFVTPEEIEAFHQEMQAAGVDYRFVSYPGARHAFTNPDATAVGERYGLPVAYDADADARSWADMKQFLAESLGG